MNFVVIYLFNLRESYDNIHKLNINLKHIHSTFIIIVYVLRIVTTQKFDNEFTFTL